MNFHFVSHTSSDFGAEIGVDMNFHFVSHTSSDFGAEIGVDMSIISFVSEI